VEIHRVLWLTGRSERHQQMALQAAPTGLQVTICENTNIAKRREMLRRTDFLVSERRGTIDKSLLEIAPNLKLIVRLGTLMDDIDLQAVHLAGVRLSCQPVLETIMVAEYCLMMIMALLKKLNAAQALARITDLQRPVARTDENTFRYNWAGMGDVRGLYGKTVSIIGMGEIGVELTRRLKAFLPAQITYFKRHPYPQSVERELGITYAPTLEAALAAGEILVLLLPYSPETDQIINATAFARMPRGSLLIHAGSGSTLDEHALVAALHSGHLGGAALDTFEYEPLLANHPLLALAEDPIANVILTPHVAASTIISSRARDYDELVRFVRGQPLQHEVPPPAP
jgi:D-3-phosphoglycerate dehydrogenase